MVNKWAKLKIGIRCSYLNAKLTAISSFLLLIFFSGDATLLIRACLRFKLQVIRYNSSYRGYLFIEKMNCFDLNLVIRKEIFKFCKFIKTPILHNFNIIYKLLSWLSGCRQILFLKMVFSIGFATKTLTIVSEWYYF